MTFRRENSLRHFLVMKMTNPGVPDSSLSRPIDANDYRPYVGPMYICVSVLFCLLDVP